MTVTDVERSIPFYEALFGTAPAKRKPGYARFSIAEPALNFTLSQGERSQRGALDHAGIQVESTEDVLAAKTRLVAAGLAAFAELDTTCCYARQDKIWVRDPDGTPWEVFVSHEDTEEPGSGGVIAAEAARAEAAGEAACGCAAAGCACTARGAESLCCSSPAPAAYATRGRADGAGQAG